MKIERISDTQIRCILTREDLANRHMKLSELAYGTDNARSLFQEMMLEASLQCDFEADNLPLMIEAIPMSSEAIVLLITKVESPDELDTRFSQFSKEPDEKSSSSGDKVMSSIFGSLGADDILDIFHKLTDDEKKPRKEEASSEDYDSPSATSVTEESEQNTDIPMFRIFAFRSLERVTRLAHVLGDFYDEENSLYKDPETGCYYLSLHKGQQSPANFNRVCNTLSEYASQLPHDATIQAYLDEHFTLLIRGDALQTLIRIHM